MKIAPVAHGIPHKKVTHDQMKPPHAKLSALPQNARQGHPTAGLEVKVALPCIDVEKSIQHFIGDHPKRHPLISSFTNLCQMNWPLHSTSIQSIYEKQLQCHPSTMSLLVRICTLSIATCWRCRELLSCTCGEETLLSTMFSEGV